jgi:hypothetical protein
MMIDLSTNSITVVGIDVENTGSPIRQGPGGALYAVPIKLSATPSTTWSQLFPDNWDRPPEWSSRHRPGIARVIGDCIVLNGTTVEEVRDIHAKTLKLAVEATNEQATAIAQRQRMENEAAMKESAEHKAKLEEVAAEVNFDCREAVEHPAIAT